MRNSRPHQSHLPRLDEGAYNGLAMVHWTLTLEKRATLQLDSTFQRRFRELTLHAAARHPLVCPVYCLMPDHMHFVWCGISPHTRQLLAMRFLRRSLNSILNPVRLQHQAHDHVLDDTEREEEVFQTTCAYVLMNPVRDALVAEPREWQWTGCIVPGYPFLHPLREDYWRKFWKLYRMFTGGPMPQPDQ